MIAKLDRYLIRSLVGLFAGLTVLAIALLLLERLIRIIEIVSGSSNTALAAALMVANLIPHYLDLAIPGAFLIAMIVTIDRLSRSGEIVALMAAGVSLYRIVLPYVGFAAMLALMSLLISGFLQPLSRYSYRQIVHNMQNESVITAFQESKFVQFDGRIVWTDSVAPSTRRLGQTFILETRPDGSRTFLTGGSGRLTEVERGKWVITLDAGSGGTIGRQGTIDEGDRLEFGELTWPINSDETAFRPRGGDERELFLPELLSVGQSERAANISPEVAVADFHDRTSRAALLLVMPLIAVVLGLNLGRIPRSSGVVLGILFLLGVQKVFEYLLAISGEGGVPAWSVFWPFVGMVGVTALLLFQRLATRRLLFGGPRIRAQTRAAYLAEGGRASASS
ncbi:LptF/LptG family permease [Hyphomonas sp.]|uniref:LptF/LptG family permease n=1 Tax=Hyphomonas sp. TaxID=87 RepID=UPI0025C63EF1|nr:LptF/LptG family permease [Hyphomonas sp.]